MGEGKGVPLTALTGPGGSHRILDCPRPPQTGFLPGWVPDSGLHTGGTSSRLSECKKGGRDARGKRNTHLKQKLWFSRKAEGGRLGRLSVEHGRWGEAEARFGA